MRIWDAPFQAMLNAAADTKLDPVWFLWIVAQDRATGAAAPMGFWSGDEDLTLTVARPDGSGSDSRTYYGQCGFLFEAIPLVLDLTDNAISVTLSQIADPVMEVLRGRDSRHAWCELHASAWSGGTMGSAPQLFWVGIVDEAVINTPPEGQEGSAVLSIRSELMAQLGATNPAVSSDEHQKRRQAGDQFSRYSGVIGSKEFTWYKE